MHVWTEQKIVFLCGQLKDLEWSSVFNEQSLNGKF